MGAIVYAYDQRGFGQSPAPGVWPGSGRLVADLTQIVALVRAQHPSLPLFLVGDSMGAAIVCLAAQGSAPGTLAGVVLNAPAVWGAQSFNPLYRGVLWLAAKVAPSWEMTGRGVKITVTDNIPLLRSLSRDPFMLKTARVDALYGMVALMDDAQHAASQLHVPTLLLYGERDEVIPKNAVCAFASALPSSLTAFFYPDGYHLLLRDYGAPLVWSDAAAWFNGEARSGPSWRQMCGDALVSENP
jgi:alpha-beta hydrolase superfamily lysophospholipase